jgi:metal-dependent HD superfamily phosphatase/phosphodiesterase
MTLAEVKEFPEIEILIEAANRHLAALGYTDHGHRHVGFVSKNAALILDKLGFDKHTVELAAIAGYLHDVGNAVNRNNHSSIGASLIFPLLLNHKMPIADIVEIITAIGNHDEDSSTVSSPIAAALIIADKSDAHKSRVRNGKPEPDDIHDRVNYAIQHNKLTVCSESRVIIHQIEMDDSSSILEYLSIYMPRIALCEAAAEFLNCSFELCINGHSINGHSGCKGSRKTSV